MNKGKIMRKLLGQPTNTSNEPVDTTSISSPQLRPSASQNTVFTSRAPIACVDKSPDGQHAVIAGQKVFKTLRVDGSTITEEVDLRTIITNYAASHDNTAATADQLNIKAVKWSHTILDTTIITACGNGRITLYDLTRAGEGLEVARIQEHHRQINKLDINPFKCNWLLSASQDGTIKSFDLRSPFQGRNGPIFRTWHTFKCNAEAVRDVKWSPTDGFEFACSTDTGNIQKWDVRKPSAPVFKINAHQGACFSLSWHPDGQYLVSGGIDQHCYVWDVSKTAERGQKPKYSLATPAQVSLVTWRPPCWSATAKGKRAAQVTVAYDEFTSTRHQTSSVHLWDLARPTMPFKEIEHWDSSPTGLLWNTRDLLWSVDRDGRFTQTDVAFVPQLIERRSLSTFSFSSTGDTLMLLESRQAPLRARHSLGSPDASATYPHSSTSPLLSVSRSDSEEDVVGSFLGPRQRKRQRYGDRSQSLSTTPPNLTGIVETTVMSLDDAVNVTGPYKPQQVMAIGHAPSSSSKSLYKYYTNRYLERISKDREIIEAQPRNVRMGLTMEFFARTAENIAHYRLAQTWRLLAYTMNLLLVRRAEYHRQSRLTGTIPIIPEVIKKQETKISPFRKGQETPRKMSVPTSPFSSPLHITPKPLVKEDFESTSNVATPLVRPVRDIVPQEGRSAMHMSLVEDDILELPGAAHATSPSPIPMANSSFSSGYTASSVEGYDFYGMESFSPSISFAAPQRKEPLRLDYSDQGRSATRIQPQRHDSGESFQMFSTSGESQHGAFMSSSHSDHDQSHIPPLKDRVISWENTHISRSQDRSSIDSMAQSQSESSEEYFTPYISEMPKELRRTVPKVPAPPPVVHVEEASAPTNTETWRPEARAPPPPKEEVVISGPEEISNDPGIIESDYLPWANDPEFTISPIDPKVLAQRSVSFEAQTGALNAAAMVLLLRPLLPPDAIDEIQAEAILGQYHHRLQSMKLFTEGTLLRNLCVPLYPSVFAMAQENITTGYYCTDCHKPLENDPLIPSSQWRCPRCQKAMSGCAICLQRDAVHLDDGVAERLESVLWWYCPGCGHGGHTAFMAAWHSGPEYDEGSKYSGGCCPLEGCLHPCLPGTWREKMAEEKRVTKQKELELLVRENSRQGSGRGRGVRRDAREVNQSKAVEGVRVALGIGGLERKKSVKVIVPGEV